MNIRLHGQVVYDPAISLLCTYQEMKSLSPSDTWIPLFIAALFKRAKVCKQTKYLSTDEQIKKM